MGGGQGLSEAAVLAIVRKQLAVAIASGGSGAALGVVLRRPSPLGDKGADAQASGASAGGAAPAPASAAAAAEEGLWGSSGTKSA